MNQDNSLKPQALRGFNDWFAPDVRLREFVISTFKSVFEKYGYEPLETPAVEYSQFMLGISGAEAEKQFYRFKDSGDRDVMLKYEVMTGMCRAVASNINNIAFPYKRYQIQPVWRAENTQKGRYRQFTQCDADTIGSSTVLMDAEFIQMGLEIIRKLGFEKFIARISNRKFLNGLREYLEISQESFYGICMSVDKLKKIGRDGVVKELVEKRKIDSQKAGKIMEITDTSNYDKLDNYQIIEQLSSTIGKTDSGSESLSELRQIFDYLKLSNVSEDIYRFDTSIARGLASYTGPIWEFEIIDGDVGSIGGAGRYDNLIGRYLGQGKQVPATGGSFGIERICDIIKDRNMFDMKKTNTKVLVATFSNELMSQSIQLSNQLRSEGVNTLLYPVTEKLGKQFKYASDKNIPFVAVIGPDEAKNNQVTLKNMATGEQKTINQSELINSLKNS
ncbi:histidine--tRNA ligase [Candidatus Shapirobacteria bacterium]|nr:histidine--tRNA ligase [Candidatus Shapirobacteria bacterium]